MVLILKQSEGWDIDGFKNKCLCFENNDTFLYHYFLFIKFYFDE